MSIGLILSGLAVLLIGVAWSIQRSAINGTLFIVMLFVFLSAATSSYWEIIFSVLSALVATLLLVIVVKRKTR